VAGERASVGLAGLLARLVGGLLGALGTEDAVDCITAALVEGLAELLTGLLTKGPFDASDLALDGLLDTAERGNDRELKESRTRIISTR
jgi:hypothetical protein